MRVRSYSFDRYVELVRDFHGYAAPGVLVGGYMVDLAYRHLHKAGLYNALCETRKCLPDAIQLLTACTTGNGWLTIHDTGRFAVTFYEKRSRQGIRVSIDTSKLDFWPEIKTWFLKLKPKAQQEEGRLRAEISAAGSSICVTRYVKVADRFIIAKDHGPVVVCPCCNETYPSSVHGLCPDCRGESGFVRLPESELESNRKTTDQTYQMASRNLNRR
ncbi:MAG TPA: formylmethanofuran dehydrogenase subunit E family protein [Syntrophorhabdaceae bacterium]|nr:formylmethanofuran dehydrogenase subunit E family protein [Syntrophorhabdaceae bacterium]